MFSHITFAALVAALPALATAGSAIVKNYCDTDVNLWSVSNEGTGDMINVRPGATYSEAFRSPASGGISIKMTHKTSLFAEGAAITQFEYTLTDKIWYDISNIDGNPFWRKGMSITPTDSSCPTKVCPAGEEQCKDAYMVWNDDHATAACSASSDIVFNLCSGNIAARDAAPEPAAANETRKAAPEPAPEAIDNVEDIHANMRKRAAHRHHFHRRGAVMQ